MARPIRPESEVEHGTYAGYMWHRRVGGKVTCAACLKASHDYQVKWAKTHQRKEVLDRQKTRMKALRLLGKKYSRELEWLIGQIEKGNL